MLKNKNSFRAVGITCGIGSMLVGARQAGFEVAGNIEWRKYYHASDPMGQNTFRSNFNDAVFKESIDNLSPQEVEKIMNPDIALGHPECLIRNTAIFTSTGWQKIQDIKTGDRVLTHRGQFRKVKKIYSNQIEIGSKIVHLMMATRKTNQRTLILTPNHPVLTKNQKWVRADAICPDDQIILMSSACEKCGGPVPIHPNYSPRFCSISCSVDDRWDKMSKEDRTKQVISANNRTRELVKNGQHHFYRDDVRRNAMRELGRKKNGTTWLERRVGWVLQEKGIVIEKQHQIGKYFVDFAIIDKKIAIECDGEYWHRQDDPRRQQFIEGEGWTVIRLPEARINTDLVGCAAEVERIAANHSGQFKFSEFSVTEVGVGYTTQRQTVYNLGVEEDSSYVAKGFVVHNCGNFSGLGASVKGWAEKKLDPADIPLFVDLVKKVHPRFFVMDDLPGSFAAFPMSEYHARLPDYDLYPEWVSNWGYGNIQKHRKRMFMLGSLKKEKWVFRAGETSESGRSLENCISDLPSPRKGSNYPNHDPVALDSKAGRNLNMRFKGDRPTWREVGDFAKANWKSGESMTYHAEDGTIKRKPGYKIEHWDDRGASVQCGQAYKLHPIRMSPLTFRERARIQGFPDDFIFYGTKFNEAGEFEPDKNIHITKQTGKAMPVQFCNYVSRQIMAHMQGENFNSSGVRLLEPNEHIDQAKKWYCQEIGYSNQPKACGECWLANRCTIRYEKYKIGSPSVVFTSSPKENIIKTEKQNIIKTKKENVGKTKSVPHKRFQNLTIPVKDFKF